jgi:hypothetical protein
MRAWWGSTKKIMNMEPKKKCSHRRTLNWRIHAGGVDKIGDRIDTIDIHTRKNLARNVGKKPKLTREPPKKVRKTKKYKLDAWLLGDSNPRDLIIQDWVYYDGWDDLPLIYEGVDRRQIHILHPASVISCRVSATVEPVNIEFL